MGRVLAIDYGEKRTGLAVSDVNRIIASPLKTVSTSELLDFIADYLKEEEVDEFVVGLAKQMNNTMSESSVFIEPFVNTLSQLYPDKKINRVDERFTSKIATESIRMAGAKKKKRQDKALVDMVSATIILQDFLNSN